MKTIEEKMFTHSSYTFVFADMYDTREAKT